MTATKKLLTRLAGFVVLAAAPIALRSLPVADNDTVVFVVLKLTLGPSRYAWEFVPVAGEHFRDAGSAACSPAR